MLLNQCSLLTLNLVHSSLHLGLGLGESAQCVVNQSLWGGLAFEVRDHVFLLLIVIGHL
ncbi:hypothetical protein D3C85_1849350 [compost metagenome]